MLARIRGHYDFWVGLGLGKLLFESSQGQRGSAYMETLISIPGLYVWYMSCQSHTNIHISPARTYCIDILLWRVLRCAAQAAHIFTSAVIGCAFS